MAFSEIWDMDQKGTLWFASEFGSSLFLDILHSGPLIQSPKSAWLEESQWPFTDVSLSADEGLSKNRGCPKLWQVANRDQDDKLINHQIWGVPYFQENPAQFQRNVTWKCTRSRGPKDMPLETSRCWSTDSWCYPDVRSKPKSFSFSRQKWKTLGLRQSCLTHILSKSPQKKQRG